jgi:TP901 family phage tail tape measure protein
MSDQMFDFDTSKERQQVEAFDRSLDKLMANVERLDRMSVDRLSRQFDELSKGQTTAVRNMTEGLRKLVQDMDQLARLSSQKMKSFSDLGPVQALVQGIKKGGPELQAALKVALAEMQNQIEINNRAMVAEATSTANKMGAAFSNLNTLVSKNLVTNNPYKGLFDSFSAGLQGSKGAITKAAKESANVFMDSFAEEAARGRQIFANFDRTLGLSKGAIVKSAKDSASVFIDAFSNDVGRSRQLFSNFEQALGLSKGYVAKSAKDSADVFAQAFAVETARNRQLWSGFESSLGMNREAARKSAKESAEVFAETYAIEVAKNRQLFSNFEKSLGIGSNPRGNAAASAAVFMNAGLMPKAEEVDKLSKSFRKLTSDGNDVHSMARGLASGFGALWLTWGNLVPLFIGAGISNAFVQTAKTGMTVAHTMGIIANLGGNTADEMSALTAEMDRMGKSGPKGPIAIAEAMQVLSLAGLKANDILRVTQDVMNFSVAGTTDLKTAADVLVSISTAFDMGANGFGRVADVVSKAAAESKTSVESFGNAMKTASVIHKQYGVSLEDTATGIAALSQLGIEGTAAGTALRNMYADLSGRSVQVAKVLKNQGIEMRKANGEFKPMIQVVGELNDKFMKLDGISQKNLMQALLSERGAKGIIEMLSLIGTTAVGMQGNVTNALVVLQEKITESYGFAAINAAKMAQTAQSQFEAVKATLQTSMNEAYRAMEPQLLVIFDALKKAFGSPEFVEGIKTLVDMVSRFALVLTQNIDVLVVYAGTMAGLKLAQMALVASAEALLAIETLANRNRVAGVAAMEADTIATAKNAAAKTGAAAAAGAAAGGMGTLARLLPGIGTAVTVLAGAWMAYEFWQSKSNDSSKVAADLYTNNVAKALDEQASKIERLNALRIQGLSLTEAQARLDAEGKIKESGTARKGEYDKALSEYNAALTDISKAETGFFPIESFRKSRIADLTSVANAKLANLKSIENQINADAAKTDAAMQRVAAASKKQAELTNAEVAAASAAREKLFGTGKYELGQDAGGGKNKERFNVPNSNEIQQLEKLNNARLTTLQNGYDNEKKLLDARYQAGLVLEGDYQAKSLIATIQYEEKYKAALEQSNKDYVEVYEKRYGEVKAVRDAAEKAGNKDAVTRLDQELQNLTTAKQTYIETNMEKVSRMEADATLRNAMATVKAEGAIAKLIKTDKEYWQEQQNREKATKEANAIADYYENASQSVLSFAQVEKAAVTAALEERNKHTQLLTERQRMLDEAELAYTSFINEEVDETTKLSKAWQDEALRLAETVARIKGVLDVDKSNVNTAIQRAATDAAIRAQDKQIRAFTNGIADAMTTAVFEGGKTGGKQLRDFLKKELLREPFTIMLRGLMNGLLGSIGGLLMGAFGGGGGEGGAGGAGGLGGIMNLVSMGRTAYGAYGALSGATGLGGLSSFAGGYGGSIIPATMVGPSIEAPSIMSGLGNITSGATGGFGGSGFGSALGAGAGFMAVAAVVLNALGAFRSERRVNSGLRGTLGRGDITPWEEWREGGTLFSGPSYSTFNPIEALTKERARLKEMMDTGVDPSRIMTQQMIVDNLEKQYGGMEEAAKAQSKYIQGVFDGMKKSVMDMGKTLGLNTDKVKDFTTLLGGEKGINLEGLKPEEQQAKIAEALATANNELAQQIIGSWETTTTQVSRVISENVGSMGEDAQYVFTTITDSTTNTRYVASEYAKEGEKAIDTLTRLAVSLDTVNKTFDALGYTLLDASLASGDLASKIIEAFGSIEAFTASTGYYFENFYSDSEKTAARARQLDKTFSSLGVAVPKTEAEFRALVESQDLTTESGRKMYASLLGIAPLFHEVANAGKDAGRSLEEIAKEQLDKAADALRDAFRVAMDALQLQIDAAQATVDSLSGLVAMLRTNIRELYNQSTPTSQLSANQGNAYINKALAELKTRGVIPDEAKLSEAISSVRGGFDNKTYTSQFEEDNDRLVLAGKLSQMHDILEPQLTTAEATLKRLNEMYKAMQRELDQIETQIKLAEQGLTATLDIATAIRDFQSAFHNWMMATTGDGTGGTGGGTGGTGGGTPAPHKPMYGGGGGGGSTPPAGRGTTPRASYGADEALTSFEKFKTWYNGYRYNADPAIFDGTKGYKVPDWMRISGLADDATDEEMFGQYLFYKNNPQYAKDFEQVFTTGKTSYTTDGSSLNRFDLSKMPKEVAEYYKNNNAALLMADGFGLDPVLAYQLYYGGPEQFGLDGKKMSFTQWLRDHKWTESGITSNNNIVEYAQRNYPGVKLTKWDTATGTLVDLDGKIYTPDGKFVGTASQSMMESLYGKDFLASNHGGGYGNTMNSALYNQQVGGGYSSAQEYYSAIRTNIDKLINDGWSAQQLVDALKSTGASLSDAAMAYGISVDEVRKNLIAGGATNLPAFADGGMHSGGLRIVGERGWELEATGPSRIWNQDQLADALVGKESGSSYDVEIVAELRAIHATNEQMLAELIRIRQINQSWDNEGLPVERQE